MLLSDGGWLFSFPRGECCITSSSLRSAPSPAVTSAAMREYGIGSRAALSPMTLAIRVSAVGVAGCENEEGFEKVRLSLAVIAREYSDAARRLKVLRGVVPEMGQ